MNPLLVAEQSLNGLQLGLMLFMMGAGMTLMLGIMNLVNLAYGALYMLGAYFAVTLQWWTGSFLIAAAGSLLATAVAGVAMETSLLRQLYQRSYLDQVLCTIGLSMFLNEAVRLIWGGRPLHMGVPPALAGTVELLPGLNYPILRLAIIAVGLVVGAGLYLLIAHTKIGIQIRAGASNRAMAGVMGINIKVLFTLIFALGAALAGLAGIMAGPLLSVGINMGDGILVLTLVVIVIGGIGSVRGALIAAILVGFIDTWARLLLPSALGDIGIYLLMAGVLFLRPRGLFPGTT
jgi:branched-subunit amino acid ABC-type transport system permease component